MGDPLPGMPPGASHSRTSSYLSVVVVLALTAGLTQISPAAAAATTAPASTPDGTCGLCVLAPDGTSLTLHGNGSLQLARSNLMVNSSSNAAISLTGNSAISAPSVGVVGGVSSTGNAVVSNLTTGASPAADPLVGTPTPSVPTGSPQSLKLNGGQRAIFPGVYSDIFVTGQGSLFLNGGTYVILDDFSVAGKGSVSGRGVTIYLACSTFPSPCSSGERGASLELMGSGRFGLTAPTGICSAGQLAIQSDPNNTSTISLSGDPSDSLAGAIFAPSGTLVTNGQGNLTIGGQVVVAQAFLNGNGRISVSSAGALISAPTLSLSPPSAGPDQVGSEQTLTATLVDGLGRSVANEQVGLTVAGANTAASSAVTNNAGQADLSYAGVRAGSDTAQAQFGNGDVCVKSNKSSVTWTANPAPITTGPVQGNFYVELSSAQSFVATPASTPLFGQQFPVVDFNPPSGLVPGNISGVGPSTRPFTDVTTNVRGEFTGTIVAQGNGIQAGVGGTSTFDAALTSTFNVSTPGDVSFMVIVDDGFILGVGNGATPVSGPNQNPPPSGKTPFSNYPVMAAWNGTGNGAPTTYAVTIHFPAAGAYPYELDYFSCCGQQLSLVLAVTEQGPTPPVAAFLGYADTVRPPGTSTFPSPWQGSPGVTFVGAPNSDGTWDTGALRFDNTTGSPVTLNHVTVNIGSTQFDPGFVNETVPAHSTLVLAGAAANFDTSDGGSGSSGATAATKIPATTTASSPTSGYTVPNPPTAQQVNRAIQNAVDYIDFTQQNSNGSFGNGGNGDVAETAAAVLAYGVLDRGDAGNLPTQRANPTNPSQVHNFQTDLTHAVAWLLSQQDPNAPSLAGYGGSWNTFGGYQTYSAGLALTALSTALTVPTSSAGAVATAIANGRAFLLNEFQAPPFVTCTTAQNDPTSSFCGGWNYEADRGRSDESNTGYAMTGLQLTGGVPPAIAQMNAGWQNNVQADTTSNPSWSGAHNDGGGSYQPAYASLIGSSFSSNANNSGTLLFGFGDDGVAGTDPRAQKALQLGADVLDTYEKAFHSSISSQQQEVNHQTSSEDGSCDPSAGGCAWGFVGDGGYHYSMFALSKGMGAYIPPTCLQGAAGCSATDGSNWYAKIANLLVNQQNTNTSDTSGFGSWPSNGRDDFSPLFATGLSVFALGLVAVCVGNSTTAQIQVSISGVATPYTDTAKILTAGGHDGECGGGNESHDWVQLNPGVPTLSAPMPPALTLALTPSSIPGATVGQPEQISVAATDNSGQAVAGLHLTLGVFGANPQQLTAITDSSGNAAFSYIGSNAGDDLVTATTFVSGVREVSNTLKITWVIPLPPPSGNTSGTGPPAIFNLSPAAGTVVSASIPVFASIAAPSGYTISTWSLISQLLPSAQVTPIASGSGAPPSPLGAFDPTGKPAGTYALTVSATSSGGGTASASTSVVIAGAGAGGGGGGSPAQAPPSITQPSPPDGTVVYSPVPIQATITPPSGHSITSWSVTAQALAGGAPITVVTGTGTPPTLLASLDPTLLANDAYTLSISATTDASGTQTLQSTVLIAGNLKLGRSIASYRDLTVPVNGFQMEVNRVYDSTDTRSGDFGVGWHLDLANFRVSANRPLGAGGWTEYPTACFILCNWAFKSAAPHYVTVTYPDGHEEAFDLAPPNTGLTLIDFASSTAAFTGRPGVTSKLAVANVSDQALTNGFDGNLYGSAGTIYNPTQFILTTRDGRILTLDTSHGLVSEKDPSGNTLTVDSNGVHASTGSSLTFARDAAGRITGVTGPSGEKLSYGYSSAGDLASYSNAAGGQSTYSYDTNHRLIAATGGSATYTNTYDSQGRLVAITDATGHTTQISNDAAAMTQTIVDAAGRLTTIDAFDAPGDLIQETRLHDRTSQVYTFTYDTLGHVLTAADPLGGSTSLVYDSAGDVLSSTDAVGNVTRYTYDTNGHLSQVTRPDGVVDTTLAYDAAGRIISQSNADGTTATYSYDAGGHPVSVVSNKNGTTSLAYSANGYLTSLTNPLGATAQMTYDASGRLLSVSGPASVTVTYAYDALGDMTSVTDALGNSQTAIYDLFGRMTSTRNASGQSATINYGAAGLRASTVDALGLTTTYSYDADNRLVSQTAGGQTQTYSYDGAGHLTSAVDSAATVTFTFDAADRATSQTESGPGLPTTTVSDTYDAAGRLTSITGPQGPIRRAYDADGRLTAITDGTGTSTFAYDSGSRLVSLARPNGATDNFTYDAAGHVTGRTTTTSGVTVDSLAYTYTASGSIASRTQNGDTAAFSYDSAGRLVGVQHSDPTLTSESFAYDTRNNRTSWSGAPGSYTYGVDDQLLSSPSATFAYDAAGQRTSVTEPAGTTSYVWDANHHLTSIAGPGGKSVAFRYDALGRRVTASDGTSTQAFVYSGNQVLAQYANGALQSAFTPISGGGAPLDVVQGGSKYFYVQDQQGTVNGLLDASGAVAQRYSYSAFGVPGASSGSVANPFTFTSLQYDSTGGAYYANARYYDPQGGVFLSRDPISALNPYTYVGGDPINFSDPTGAVGFEYARILQFDLDLGDRVLGCITGALTVAVTSAILKLVKPSAFSAKATIVDAGLACALGAFFPGAGRGKSPLSNYPDLFPDAAASLLRGQAGYIAFSALVGFLFGFALDALNQAIYGQQVDWGHAVAAGVWAAIGGTAGGVAGNLSVNASGRVAAAYAIGAAILGGGVGSVQGLGDPPSPPCK